MGTFSKVFGVISLLVVAVVAGVMLLPHSSAGHAAASNEVLSAREIIKNPYKFKGMSGVMGPGGMRFSHMAGDNTAIYDSIFVYSGDQLAVTMDDNEPPSTGRWWRVHVEGADDFTNELGAQIRVAEVKFEGYADPPPPPATAPVPVQAPVPAAAATVKSTPESAPDKNGIFWNISPAERDKLYPEMGPGKTQSDGTQPPAPIERRSPPQN